MNFLKSIVRSLPQIWFDLSKGKQLKEMNICVWAHIFLFCQTCLCLKFHSRRFQRVLFWNWCTSISSPHRVAITIKPHQYENTSIYKPISGKPCRVKAFMFREKKILLKIIKHCIIEVEIRQLHYGFSTLLCSYRLKHVGRKDGNPQHIIVLYSQCQNFWY